MGEVGDVGVGADYSLDRLKEQSALYFGEGYEVGLLSRGLRC